jgi:hypothetical protein
MKSNQSDDRNKPAARKMTLHRETLRDLTESQLRDAAGGLTRVGCPSGPTCSGWPPCTC